MRKSNHRFNAKRSGFPVVEGRVIRAANTVAVTVASKVINLMQNSLLTGLLSRAPAFKVPCSTYRFRSSVGGAMITLSGYYTNEDRGVFGQVAA